MKTLFAITLLSLGILVAGCTSPSLPPQDLTLIRIQTDATTLPNITDLNPVFVLRSSAPKGFILALPGKCDIQKVGEVLPESAKIVMQEKVSVINPK